jgi:hypothetical protein
MCVKFRLKLPVHSLYILVISHVVQHPARVLTLTHAGHENRCGSDVASATRVIPSIATITKYDNVLYRVFGKIMSEAVVAHRAIGSAFPSNHATGPNART